MPRLVPRLVAAGARRGVISCLTGKSPLSALDCPPPAVKASAQKYSALPNIRFILYSHPSCPTKGALRNVNNAGRDAVDAKGAPDGGT
jgi:hypothetical protein